MRMLRPAIAIDPRLFGRRMPGFILGNSEELGWTVGEDLKLFATGWIGGLIFFGTLLS